MLNSERRNEKITISEYFCSFRKMHDVLYILDYTGRCGEELGRQKAADKAALFEFDKERVFKTYF